MPIQKGPLGNDISSTEIAAGAVTQAKLAVGIAGTGPAFSAYNNTAQTSTNGTFTKSQLNVEAFDTNNNFDSTTNYRFTPTVAGYYQFSGKFKAYATTSLVRVIGTFYKNGSTTGRFFDLSGSFGTNIIMGSGSELIYMNGTTDYIELYIYTEGTGTLSIGGGDSNTTYLTGFLARAA